MKRPFLIWAGVALLGGLLVSSPDILPGLSHFDFKFGFLSQTAMMGYLLTLVAVISWGASTVFGKKLTSQGYTETQMMSGRFIFGFVFLSFYIYSNRGIIYSKKGDFDKALADFNKVLEIRGAASTSLLSWLAFKATGPSVSVPGTIVE